MMAADSSALSAFFKGDSGPDVDKVSNALLNGALVLPPVVLTELLSDPVAGPVIEPVIRRFELLAISLGYWERAGRNRRKLIALGLKAKTAGTLIAQSCIDHEVPLIARDPDFRHFAKHCGLKLA
jgi:predicted nucleic acid-binding protein